jgi:FlaA1/EpsC-like NDP-sugar epimerase
MFDEPDPARRIRPVAGRIRRVGEETRRGKSALVTGASSGIGAEIARELARREVGELTLVARATSPASSGAIGSSCRCPSS